MMNMHINQILRPCLNDGSNYFPAPASDNLTFRFLQGEEATWIAPGLKAVFKEIGFLTCVEIKGNLERQEPFELIQEGEGFWFVFQFIGKSILNNGTIYYLESATYIGLASQGSNIILQLDRGKTWLGIIGVSGFRLSDLKKEYNNIGQLFSFDEDRKLSLKTLPIGYKHKRIFDKIQQFQGDVYSLPIAIAYYVNQLIFLFDQELGVSEKGINQQEVALYYRALAYIKEHFLDYKIRGSKLPITYVCMNEH